MASASLVNNRIEVLTPTYVINHVNDKKKELLLRRNKKLKELYEKDKEMFEHQLQKKGNKNLKINRSLNDVNISNISRNNNRKFDNTKNDFIIENSNFLIHSNKENIHLSYDMNSELDKSIKKYNQNLDQLKIDDFMSRKKLQDDLLFKINNQMEKLNTELKDQYYEEHLAQIWLKELEEKQNKLSSSHITNDINSNLQRNVCTNTNRNGHNNFPSSFLYN